MFTTICTCKTLYNQVCIKHPILTLTCNQSKGQAPSRYLDGRIIDLDDKNFWWSHRFLISLISSLNATTKKFYRRQNIFSYKSLTFHYLASCSKSVCCNVFGVRTDCIYLADVIAEEIFLGTQIKSYWDQLPICYDKSFYGYFSIDKYE